MKTKYSWLRHVFAGLLAAFFAFGGTLNMYPSEEVVADYSRWGYSGWFHYVTGTLEWITALLLVFPVSRFAGSVLGGLVMIGAAGTVLYHGEYSHALAPLIVLVLLTLNGWLRLRFDPRRPRDRS